MKRIKVSPTEFCALLRLSYKAQMDWFRELFKTRKTIDIGDLEDLSTACQLFILQKMDISDLAICINVFNRTGIKNKDVDRAEKYFNKHKEN